MSETPLLEDYHRIDGKEMQLHFGFDVIKYKEYP